MPIALIQAGTVLTAVGGQHAVPSVLIVPRAPLEPLTTYAVHVSATCGALGSRTYEWPFSTRAAVDPKLTDVSVSPPGADGRQIVTVGVRDANGRPVAGAVMHAWDTDQPTPSESDASRLEFSDLQTVRGGDGLLVFSVHLPPAAADVGLRIAVDIDGQQIQLPVHLSANLCRA